jgi:hypothetical protein
MAAPKKIILPAGYYPELDRLPPPRAGAKVGCSLPFVLGLLAMICGAAAWGLSALASTPAPSPTAQALSAALEIASFTPEPEPTQAAPTLDAWSLTGTAMLYITASVTPDYCFWLTPTPTPTATLIYTPDAWQATGTALYEATNPPQQPTPTPDIPRAWCNFQPTATPTATITHTPAATLEPEPTRRRSSAFSQAPSAFNPQGTNNDQGVIIIATAAILPMPTPPPVPTVEPSPKPPKKTATPTITPTPTPDPVFSLYQSDCDAGFPSFITINTGGAAQNVVWYIVDEAQNVYASDLWPFVPANGLALAAAPAWAGYANTYTLVIEQPWLTAVPTPWSVVCIAPETTEEPLP